MFVSRLAVRSLRFHALSARSFSSEALSIQAAVARSPTSPFTVEALKLRAIRTDEVLVKVVATGVCHTDIAVKTRDLCAFPMVLGHEGTGVVEKVGDGVSNFAEGDHVLLSYASCGHCSNCNQGKPAYCYDHGDLNFAGTHPDGTTCHTSENGEEAINGSFFQQSSFATHAIASPQNMIKVDKSLDLASLAPLGCGIQTGAGSIINSFKAGLGDTVAIFGCGGVGLSAVMAAKATNCKTVIAIDLNENRLNLATELGASHTIKISGEKEQDVAAEIKAIVGDIGVDYALDTSGTPNALRAAFEALKPHGVAGLVGGSSPGTKVEIDMLTLLPGKQLRGIIQGDSIAPVFIPTLIDMHQKGIFPFDKLVTYYDGLESINQAVEDCSKADSHVIKPVIRIADIK